MSAGRRILPVGERAVLVEVDAMDAVLDLHAALTASAPDAVEELVPAARTVLVRFDPARAPVAAVRAWIAATEPAGTASLPAREVTLEVAYDGPDLAETAGLLGLGAAELAERHARTPWRVAFTGFAPGFAYLVGDGWPFDVPRLAVPRTRVPAGAVGLAAGFTGAYPRETPGGWRLIGTTAARLFDPGAAEPVLLTPGTRVRFAAAPRRGIRPTPSPPRDGAISRQRLQEFEAPSSGTGAKPREGAAGPALRVDAVGRASVQDLGRPGLAHLGIARSGALDRGALRLANRLVGNAEDAAGIEIDPGGFAATALRELWVTVTGAWPPLTVSTSTEAATRSADSHRALLLRAGDRIEIGRPAHGARAYLAIRGGVDVPAVLGSRATDTLAGLGPAPLRAGEEIAAGAATTGPPPPLD
ncbi:MAG: carboxyltransferase domain-containing protein, partial [Microbacterium sp.]